MKSRSYVASTRLPGRGCKISRQEIFVRMGIVPTKKSPGSSRCRGPADALELTPVPACRTTDRRDRPHPHRGKSGATRLESRGCFVRNYYDHGHIHQTGIVGHVRRNGPQKLDAISTTYESDRTSPQWPDYSSAGGKAFAWHRGQYRYKVGPLLSLSEPPRYCWIAQVPVTPFLKVTSPLA